MEGKNLVELLGIAIDRGASDLHLLADTSPTLRINGELVYLKEKGILSKEEVADLIFSILQPEQKELLLTNKEIDFSFELKEKSRFRANVYFQRGSLAASFRLIPFAIKTIDELGLPSICHQVARLKQGFVLITGPTGHGKSTTLAAIIQEILTTRACHVVTIEDPVEFVFQGGKAIISQRELGNDTYSWAAALRSVLREDPDVILIGEMRDYETISSALTLAETGHLVFSTLHTNSAAQTVERIIDAFPEEAKNQVRMQFSNSLEAIISQRLVPLISGGRTVAYEILTGTPGVRNVVREGKTHLLDTIIETSSEQGMISMDACLASFVLEGKIDLETAKRYSLNPQNITRLLKRK